VKPLRSIAASSSSNGSLGSSGDFASGSVSRSATTWRARPSSNGTRAGEAVCNAATVRRIASAVAASAAMPSAVGTACAASMRRM
jgi:hypothetical protein